jgi:hypothetical protein
MIRRSDIRPEKNARGGWVFSLISQGVRVSRQFYGYTKREATRLFLEEINGNNLEDRK